MSPRAIRWVVICVFVAGIGGMVGGSIADNNGIAVTFGLISAAAAVGLILVTASAGPGAFDRDRPEDGGTARPAGGPGLDEAGKAVEDQVTRLVATGADETEVRELVRRSVALGREVSESGR